MAYDMYLDKVLLPVTPERVTTTIANQNKTSVLINDGEINQLKKAGLTEINFTALIPQSEYSFAKYKGGFLPADYFLGAFERLKTLRDKNNKFIPFQFILSRSMPDGKILFDTNLKVSLENYTVTEEDGFDLTVDIYLKQYKEYSTKRIEIDENGNAVIIDGRSQESAPNNRTYIVAAGDELIDVAIKNYGDESRWRDIFNANRKLIDDYNIGTGSPKMMIHAGQELRLPE